MRARIVLASGAALVALAVLVALSRSPPRVLATNAIQARGEIATTAGRGSACQAGEALPAGASELRLGLSSDIGPSLAVTVWSGARLLARGALGSGWTGQSVVVPVAPVRRASANARANARICIAVAAGGRPTSLVGIRTAPALAAESGGHQLSGRMWIEYLGPGDRSWFSRLAAIAERIGFGRAPGGSWVVLLVVASMLAAAALSWRLAVRELAPAGEACAGAGVRAPALTCAAVACLCAVSWSILTPPFQVPDEPDHFAYVQQLAETGRLPVEVAPLPPGTESGFSLEEETALADLHQSEVRRTPGRGTISTPLEQQRLVRDLAEPLSRRGSGAAGVATSEPPLYYALETLPYELGSGGSLLDSLELMRLLSAALGALTALFSFLFVRELLPSVRWTWSVGGLGAALAPLLGFMSGAVNPDALLFAVSAALFYALARAFHRGFTPRRAAAIGAAIAVGLLTKVNFVGLLPGALLGLLVLTRAAPRGRRAVALAVAVALAASPAILWLASASLASRSLPGLASGSVSNVAHRGSLLGEISYAWQFFLPRLPGMRSYFQGIFTARQLWFDGLVGLYGWTDTTFPAWVYDFALIPAALVLALCARSLVAGRVALRRRAPEALVYALMCAGLLALIGAASYASDVVEGLGPYWEPRYLLPLLPLAAALLALAARGAGRRWGPAAGAAIVVLVFAHALFSELLVVSRYYA